MQTTEYFDINGRCIPHGIMAEHHVQTRRYFVFEQPEIDYDTIYARLVKHLAIEKPITAQEFAERAEKILDKLRDDPQSPARFALQLNVHVVNPLQWIICLISHLCDDW